MDCLFCKIVAKEIPSSMVYEDQYTYAFLDINPTNIGHTLVVPKTHCENINDIPEEDLHRIMSTVKQITPAIQKAVGADGINIIMNNGRAAGQIIFHSHTHIVPRFQGDGFLHWKGTIHYKEGDLEEQEIAKKIRGELL
jgi:histidine triad (HIT) family protein